MGWRTPWAPAPIITEVWDVRHRAQFVDRVIVARVGGQVLLPVPLPVSGRFVVSRWEREVARLLNGLEQLHGFDDVMVRSRIETVSEWPGKLAAAASALPTL